MVIFFACAHPDAPDAPDGDADTDTDADADADSDTDTDGDPLDMGPAPIAVITVTETRYDPVTCNPAASVGMWGPYEHPAEEAVFGLEVEYQGRFSKPDAAGCWALTDAGACDPTCDDGHYCRWDNTCQEWPAHLSAGAITLSGLAEPVSLELTSLGTYALMSELPPDLFTDEPVTLRASGDTIPTFSITAPPPELLDVPSDCRPYLEPDGDLALTWTPQDPSMFVRFTMSTVPHGGGGGRYVCETLDDGEWTIPEQYLGYNASDRSFQVSLARVSRRWTDGPVQLVLTNERRCGTPTVVCP